jgi:hypothetical protein
MLEGARMQPQRVKTARVGCVVSLVLVLAIGGVFWMRYQRTISCHDNRLLLRSMAVAIDPSQAKQLVEQSRNFAFKHGFRFDIGPFGENNSDWRFRLIRKDVEVIARSPSNSGAYEVGFYNYDCIHPTTNSAIDELVNDFKIFMIEVPTGMITE